MGNFYNWLKNKNQFLENESYNLIKPFEDSIIKSRFKDRTTMAVCADYLDEHTNEHESAMILRFPLDYITRIDCPDGTKIETQFTAVPITLAEIIMEQCHNHIFVDVHGAGYLTNEEIQKNIEKIYNDIKIINNIIFVSNRSYKINYFKTKHPGVPNPSNSEDYVPDPHWDKVTKSKQGKLPELLTKLAVATAKTFTPEEIENFGN